MKCSGRAAGTGRTPARRIPQLDFAVGPNGWFAKTGIPWAEADSGHGASLSDGALSYEGGNQQVFIIQIHWSDIMKATAELLGLNVYNTSTGDLDRTLPMTHPVFQWLYCSRITSYKGFVPQSKAVHPETVSGIVSTQYDFATLVCLFTQPKWRMLDDHDVDALYRMSPGQPRQEHQRFLQGRPQPRMESIVVEANSLYFLESTTGPNAIDSRSDAQLSNPGPGVNSSFASPWPVILSKADLVKTWKRVPQHGLFSKQGAGSPTNLDAALQTVNSTVIFDKPAGTLKFEGYRLTPLESAYPPELDPIARDAIGMPNLLFDVEPAFSFTDPPYDLTGNNNNPTRGHNLAPWRGNPPGDTTGKSPVWNGLWYLIGGSKTTDGGAGKPFMFPFYDHTQIFQMVA